MHRKDFREKAGAGGRDRGGREDERAYPGTASLKPCSDMLNIFIPWFPCLRVFNFNSNYLYEAFK